MLTLTRHRVYAMVSLVILVAGLTAFGVHPANAEPDPTNPDPKIDTEAPGPVAEAGDPTGGALPADPGMSAGELAQANEDATSELAPGIVMTGVPDPAPAPSDGAPAVDDNTAGLTPDRPAADGAPAPEQGPLVRNVPVAGSSATVSFNDAAPGAALADDAPLPPYLALERDTSVRFREVAVDVPAVEAALAAESVRMSLFDDVTVDLDSTFAASPGQMGSTMWGASGDPDAAAADGLPEEADGADYAIVTIVGGGIIAQWGVDGAMYGMQPLPNGDHLIYQVGRTFPNDDPDVLPPGPDNTNGGLPGVADQSNIPVGDPLEFPTIDVLVGYDAEARAFYGNNDQTATNNIIAMVNQANVIYTNSAATVIQNMTLTGVTSTGVTPNTNSTQTYRDQLAAKADGNFDYIHGVRDAQAADLVAVISNRFGTTDGLCGISFFPTSASPAENDAYQITEASCALNVFTFTHEFGHNMCAGHDVTGGGCHATYPADMGFTDCPANKRTVMSRNTNCGVRQPVFSNPGINFGGWVPGNATTNNANVLEQEDRSPGTVSGGIADYRTFTRGDVAVAGTDGNSCVFRTVEDAIAMSPPGSTIYIAPGTYPGFTADLNYNISKDLTLAKGTNFCRPTVGGSATDVILTVAAGNTTDAVLEPSGAGTDVVLDRITLQGGNGAEGTAQIFSGASLTLNNAVVRNGVNPTGNGGGVRVLAGGTLNTVGDHQIEGNSAVNGGGIMVDGGTVNLTSLGDVDTNSASGNGGGIYAVNSAVVNINNDADVLGNSAANGGGIYADTSSTVNISGSSVFVGFSGSGNTATSGGAGIWAQGGALVTLASGASVSGNSAGSFAGGVRVVGGGTLRVNAGGSIVGNAANGIGGGGVYGSAPSTIDLNPGSQVVSNTSTAFGGGVVSFDVLDVDGGTVSPMQPVLITGNTAATNGGGVYSQGSTNLDTARVSNNTATTSGAGIYVGAGTFVMDETGSCNLAALGMDQYCNELRGNSTSGTGGAVTVTGGTATLLHTGFAGNHANEAAVLLVSNTGTAGILSGMVFQNTETTTDGDGLVTAKGSSTLYLIAVTFAGQTEPFLDSDDSPTVVTNRVLTTTPALSLVATPFGSCNMGPAGAGLPGQIIAAPVFAVDPTYPGNPNYVATNKSAYIPESNSAARDACGQLSGLATDSRDTPQLNGKGAANPATDWDIGGIEAAPK